MGDSLHAGKPSPYVTSYPDNSTGLLLSYWTTQPGHPFLVEAVMVVTATIEKIASSLGSITSTAGIFAQMVTGTGC